MNIDGATAIVTGASSGIGEELAKALAGAGAKVACCARRVGKLDATVEAIVSAGAKARAVPCDVTDPQQVQRLVATAREHFGPIDILFNNAGRFNAIGGLWECDPDDWWADVTCNLRGPMLTCHAVLPEMIQRNRGLIINMSGGGASSPLAGGSAYGSSKAALLRLTDTLAAELKTLGSDVLVLALGPGFVRTEMTQLQAERESARRWIPSSAEALAEGRDRPPTDCAQTMLELIRHARPEFAGRSFATGQDIAALADQANRLVEEDLLTLRKRQVS
jgi:NAD(P)-dependent dehydrogenase (short-subunit alcohol dehydrogenase family)